MTITRIQQVAGVLSGTSDTIVLPATPQYGNTLIAVFARAGSAPIASSLTQTNVTWVDLASGSNGVAVSHHVWYGRVTTSVGTSIAVTRPDSDPYLYAVFEYAGLLKFGTLLDQSVTASEDGQSPYTPATGLTSQPAQLFFGVLANALSGSEAVHQTAPNNGFSIVSQSGTSDAETALVNLAVVEKVSDVVDTPSVTTQTDTWVVWNTRLVTLLQDLSVEVSKLYQLDQYIADNFETASLLSVLVGDTVEPTVALEVQIQPVVASVLNLLIVPGDGLFCNLEVLLDSALTSALDLYLIGEVEVAQALDVLIGIQTFPYRAFLNLFIGASDIRLRSNMDMAVLVERNVANVSTTPESSRYLECRSLWCNVPKVYSVSTRYGVAIAAYTQLVSQMNLYVQTDFVRAVDLQVFIAPEP